MKVDLSDMDLSGVVSAAIVQSIDEKKREQLIQGAIHFLLTPQKQSHYRDAESPIEEAFHIAIRQVAIEIIREDLKARSDEILKVVSEAVDKAFSGDNRDRLINKVADQLCDGFKIEQW